MQRCCIKYIEWYRSQSRELGQEVKRIEESHWGRQRAARRQAPLRCLDDLRTMLAKTQGGVAPPTLYGVHVVGGRLEHGRAFRTKLVEPAGRVTHQLCRLKSSCKTTA